MDNWNRPSKTAERLKEAMANANMKQIDLAKATGVGKGSISNYVTGRYEPKPDIISKLAKALNCSEMWLWGYDVPMEPTNQHPPNEENLTDGERMLLDLFRKIPNNQQQLVLQMIRAALGNQE